MSPPSAARSLAADAPAKVNLGLRVLARRDDGYHEIESLFAPIDLTDAVRLHVAPADAARVGLRLHGATPDVPSDASNLAVRAAAGFLARAGLALTIEIELTKRIPSGAGLGGGSSDAGTVLRLLADAWPEALRPAELRQLALELGADVPFFLDPRPAWVTGVGERIATVPGLASMPLLLLHPGDPLSTAEVYRAFDALNGSAASPPLPDPAGDWPEESLASRLRNDLEPAALRLCPGIRRLRDRLAALAPRGTGLSGSGPTVYGVFADRAGAERAREAFDPPVRAWVAATLESR